MIYTRWSEKAFKEIIKGNVITDVIIENTKGYDKYIFLLSSGDKIIINKDLIPNIMLERESCN